MRDPLTFDQQIVGSIPALVIGGKVRGVLTYLLSECRPGRRLGRIGARGRQGTERRDRHAEDPKPGK